MILTWGSRKIKDCYQSVPRRRALEKNKNYNWEPVKSIPDVFQLQDAPACARSPLPSSAAPALKPCWRNLKRPTPKRLHLASKPSTFKPPLSPHASPPPPFPLSQHESWTNKLRMGHQQRNSKSTSPSKAPRACGGAGSRPSLRDRGLPTRPRATGQSPAGGRPRNKPRFSGAGSSDVGADPAAASPRRGEA